MNSCYRTLHPASQEIRSLIAVASQLLFFILLSISYKSTKVNSHPVKLRQTLKKCPLLTQRTHLLTIFFSSYLITGSPYHLQVSGLLRITLYFLSDMADMHGNGIVCADCLHVPNGFVDLTDRKHLPTLLHQES